MFRRRRQGLPAGGERRCSTANCTAPLPPAQQLRNTFLFSGLQREWVTAVVATATTEHRPTPPLPAPGIICKQWFAWHYIECLECAIFWKWSRSLSAMTGRRECSQEAPHLRQTLVERCGLCYAAGGRLRPTVNKRVLEKLWPPAESRLSHQHGGRAGTGGSRAGEEAEFQPSTLARTDGGARVGT